MGLSRASRSIIRQNLVIALGVIALLVLSSVLGWSAPAGAVVFHEGSTILVVLNALATAVFGLEFGKLDWSCGSWSSGFSRVSKLQRLRCAAALRVGREPS